MLFLLLGAHALADYPLQGPYLSEAKNPNTAIGKQVWKWALPSHGLIHGLFVTLITSYLWLGILEVICHCAIDFAKSNNKISFNADQLLHVTCKVLWVLAALFVLPRV
jgi:hypothetical protein